MSGGAGGRRFRSNGQGIIALMQKPLDIPLLLEKIRDLLSENGVERLRRLVGEELS